MELTRPDADIFVPDDMAMPEALTRTTHLAVGAHQDDQEFMAFHGIVECFSRTDRWFTGVCVTDGGGSARSGPYQSYTDDEMKQVRRREQRKAATLGEYACEIQLAYPSAVVKNASQDGVVRDLLEIFRLAQPEVVYLHNPADKHDTHVACMLRALVALRALPEDRRPGRVIGCEIWRSLDWLGDEEKVVLEVDRHRNLAAALSGVFDSQISGGKRYDTAMMGRQSANATFHESHATDTSAALAWGVDLTPLVQAPERSVIDFTRGFIERFEQDVTSRLKKLGAPTPPERP